jgi:hypothetical protein
MLRMNFNHHHQMKNLMYDCDTILSTISGIWKSRGRRLWHVVRFVHPLAADMKWNPEAARGTLSKDGR